jgi:hypothetical protein
MKSWLVQRGTFNEITKDIITGIDSLINFDYMGSSEFEWGALPRSLSAIIEQWKDIIIVGTGIRDFEQKELFILCNKDKESAITACVKELAVGERYQLKEYCDMRDWIEGKRKRNNFWWDLDNHWMACTSRNRIDLLKCSIEKVIEKRNKSA